MINNNLAKVTEDLGGAFSGERLVYSLEMTLLGLGAVFSVLAIIWAVLALFKVFSTPSAKKEATKEKANAPVPEAVPNTVTEAEESGDDATVAAIMAAISAYISSDEKLSEEYSGGFRVVSFKKVRDKAAWNQKN
jgi:sodium pump decarboxylase gamma subunit